MLNMNYKLSLYNKIIADCEQLSEQPIRSLIINEITDIDRIRKWLVKTIYWKESEKKERTLTEIKNELSEMYQISVSSIEKIIYGRRW